MSSLHVIVGGVLVVAAGLAVLLWALWALRDLAEADDGRTPIGHQRIAEDIERRVREDIAAWRAAEWRARQGRP